MDENQTNEIVEVEETVIIEEGGVPKGAIVAGVAAAAVAVGCGIKWLIGKLRDTNPEYVYEEDDDFEEDFIEVENSEDE